MVKTRLSRRKAAEISGKSPTWIQKLVRSGRLALLADGSIDPDSFERWLAEDRLAAENVEAQATRIVIEDGDAPHSLAEAERIKENYLAKLKELEFNVKSGSVVPVSDVRQVVASQYAAVRTRLLAIPAELAPRCAILATAEEVQALLAREIATALEALTLDLERDADGLRRALQ